MSLDVLDLNRFYASPLGVMVRKLLNHMLHQIWPHAQGMRVMGLGYTLPFLTSWQTQAERTLAFMPARQGIVHWPTPTCSATALVEPEALPLPESSIDRVLLVHALEASDTPLELLNDIWRVLAPGGRVLLIVPNRRGVWSRFDHTPFGEGRPYSQRQVLSILREAQFSPETWREALFMPPFEGRIFLKTAPAWERVGSYTPFPAGVHIIEASKQLYKPIRTKPVRRFALPLKPLLVPSPAMQQVRGRVNGD
jgi:SAM-dependent methyltransferase